MTTVGTPTVSNKMVLSEKATVGMRIRIHRGTRQIGGTCVELECEGARILLDMGMPLDGDDGGASLTPDVVGLHAPDASLLAVILSHGHADHWGLLPYAPVPPKVVMGAATRRILHAAAPFLPKPFKPEAFLDLIDRHPLQIGPFRITPYLVDHSAYDAYALMVEAGGRRLFYSGDIRAHGRKAGLVEKLIRKPPTRINAMLMEGSSVGRLDAEAQYPTEAEIEECFVEALGPDGFVLVSASAQNIDRMVSLYRACKRTSRILVLDLYAMEVLRGTGNPNIPHAGWPNLAVYVPEYQRRQIKKTGRFDLLQPYKASRVFSDALPGLARRGVMLFRRSMLADIDKLDLAGMKAIWSQWDGYLKDGAGRKLGDDLIARAIPLEVIHTSGHASIKDLKRLAAAINPRSLIPIHTFEADRFASYFENVVRRADGEWWGI